MSKPELTPEEWEAAMSVVMSTHAEEKAAKEVEDVTPPATAVTNAAKKRGPKRRTPVAKVAPVKPVKADEDLDDDGPDDNLSLPDGSFFIANENDLRSKIDALLNAEQGASTPAGKPYALDVKAHIADRAAKLHKSDLVPDAWKQELEAHKVAAAIDPDAPVDIKGGVPTATRPGNPQMAAKHSVEDRRKLAAAGKALPDGSYPIDDVDDLRSALSLAKSGHGNVAAAKKLIVKRAKALNAENLVPADWRIPGAAKNSPESV